MSFEAIVIYEDEAVEVKEFGPHKLLCAAVGDQLKQDLYQVRARVHGIPAKGSGKLLKNCSRDQVERLARQGQPVAAFVDSDRVHELLGLDKATCRPGVLEHFRNRTDDPPNLKIVLLEENVEDLLQVVGEIMTVPADQLTEATARKNRNARDRILNRCATAGLPEQRADVLKRMPSFARLVAIVTEALSLNQG